MVQLQLTCVVVPLEGESHILDLQPTLGMAVDEKQEVEILCTTKCGIGSYQEQMFKLL